LSHGASTLGVTYRQVLFRTISLLILRPLGTLGFG
jgi:hypothetical protein